MQNALAVKEAFLRIKDYVLETPVITSEIINSMFGHEIYFKLESLQHTGAFKVRGVFNYFLSLSEGIPKMVSASSTGNHGLGVSFVAKKLNMQARIYLPECSARIKVAKMAHYGAEIIRTNSALEAAEGAKNDAHKGFSYFPSANSEMVIAGAGTLCFEALKQLSNVKLDGIFASCASGGLIAGCVLAKNILSPQTKVFGTEKQSSDHVLRSIMNGKAVLSPESADTLADGLNTYAIANTTLPYLRSLDGFFLVEEEETIYWTKVLNTLLNVNCEAACAINMASVAKWLECQNSPQKVLVIISGGNLNDRTRQAIFESVNLFEMHKKSQKSTAKFFDFQKHIFPDINISSSNADLGIREHVT
jgi:threonine dehydratase